MSDAGTSQLEARIAQLEAENEALRSEAVTARPVGSTDAAGAPPLERRRRGRTVAAVILVVVALLITPVAVITAWARLQLVDTDQFVATFAPLAEEPAVQEYIGDQVTTAIEEQVDIPALTSDLFDGIRELNLSPRAEQALGLLEAPATQGLESLVSGVVDRIVESPAFADIWRTALAASHRAFVAAVQGDPDAALEIGGDGTVSVQLGPVIEAVKDRLEQQGVGFAANIPVVERSIVIAQNDAFVLVQTIYALAVAAGTWLPWICLALLAAGVFVAKRRTVALVWTAAGLALTMLILAAGLGIGRTFFIGTVSPSIMPSDTASVLFDGLVELMLSTIVAILVLSVLVAVIAWFSGPWRPARAARAFAGAGFASARKAAARHGVTTGSFGIGLDRWRGAVYIAIALIAAAVVLFNRPVTVSAVIWTVVVALIAVVIVELLRRPADEVAATEAEAALARAEADADAAEASDVDLVPTAELSEVEVVTPAARTTDEPPSPADPARRTD